MEPVSRLTRQTPARYPDTVTGSFNDPDAPSLPGVRVEKIGRRYRTRGQHRRSDPHSLCHATSTPLSALECPDDLTRRKHVTLDRFLQ